MTESPPPSPMHAITLVNEDTPEESRRKNLRCKFEVMLRTWSFVVFSLFSLIFVVFAISMFATREMDDSERCFYYSTITFILGIFAPSPRPSLT